MKGEFAHKWSKIKEREKYADEVLLFVRPGDKPATQRQLNLYYYYLYIRKILEHSKAQDILEVGCGRGTMSLYLAEYMNANVSLLDNEKDAIDIARKAFEVHGKRGAFYERDAENTGLPDEAYDAVVSIGLAEHFSNTDKLFKEQFRLLRPGGVMISLNIPKKRSVQELNTLFRAGKKLIGKYEDKVRKDYYRNTYSPQEFLESARQAGFKELGVTHVCPFPIFTPLSKKWDARVASVYKFILRARALCQKYPFKTNRFFAQAHFLVGYKKAL